MIQDASPDARPGDVVAVYDKKGELFGHALYNPHSQIALRMLCFGAEPVDEAFWQRAVGRATDLRRGLLRLDEACNAYRLVHAEGDDLSGLIVDRYDDVLSVEVFSIAMWRLAPMLLPLLHAAAGTRHHLLAFDARAARQEGAPHEPAPIRSDDLPNAVTINENGVRFRVQVDVGHKTGFFCDQRDNRRRLADMTRDADVLDLCCYTGGFGLYAKVLGGARSVTGVDLDETAIELARKNANLNNVRIDFAQADAFTYMRQMASNARNFDVVVLDPPKLIFGRSDDEEGRHKYADLNRLAAGLVRPGRLLLTCSCSGALSRADFVGLVLASVRHAGRQAQILDVTGAAPDHPVSPRCRESEYLKAAWLRVI